MAPQQQLREALRALDESDADLAALAEINERMAAIADRFAVLAAELVANLASSQAQLLEATKQMQETQMSFNLQYLQLQSQMQHENRAFTAVSNIMKTKHDTVKNSISNIR
jgi:translation elongation factor EF-1beta